MRLGSVGDGHRLAELLDATGTAVDHLGLVALVEVVGSKVLVGGALLDEVVDDDQDSVCYRNGRSLPAAALGNPPVVCPQVGLGAGQGAGRFGECGAQQLVARSDAG